MVNRCPTRDRLLHWGIQTDSSCLLCNSAPESRNHILFQCPYAWDLLQQVLTSCRVTPLQSWNDSVPQMQNFTGGRNLQRLTRLGWQATIYWIWNERNNRLHRQHFRSTDALFRLIDRQIKDKLLSLRPSSPIISSTLMQLWL